MLSSWLKNYKHSSYFAKRIKPAVYFAGHHPVVSHLTERNRVIVACPKDDAETILGYLCFAPPRDDARAIVHFVFVKEAFRKMGVATRLFHSAGITSLNDIRFSHWTFPVDDLIRKHEGMLFDPYCL